MSVGQLVSYSESCPNLSVQSQKNEHDEETHGPKLGQRHHSEGLGVRNERQARTWRTLMEVIVRIELYI